MYVTTESYCTSKSGIRSTSFFVRKKRREVTPEFLPIFTCLLLYDVIYYISTSDSSLNKGGILI